MSWATQYPWSAALLREPLNSFYRGSHSTAGDGGAPSVSPVGSASLYYEVDDNTLKLSVSGGAWATLTAAGAASGWTDDGTVVRLTTVTDQVGIGTAAPVAGAALNVVGISRFDLPDNSATPFRIIETASGNIYFQVVTTNGGEEIFMGDGLAHIICEIDGNDPSAFVVRGPSGSLYFALNTNSAPQAWQICDNLNNAVVRQAGTGGFKSDAGIFSTTAANAFDPIASRGLQVKTHSAFGGATSVSTKHTVAVQTVDATTTVMTGSTVTLPASSAFWFEAAVVARETDDTDSALFRFMGLIDRAGGGALIEGQGALAATIATAGALTWTAVFSVSGNDCRISVTGAAGDTINWVGTLWVQAVTTNN